MEKAQQAHMQEAIEQERLELAREPTVLPLPPQLRQDGGILLDVTGREKTGNLKLAADEHVSVVACTAKANDKADDIANRPF